jgi:hypothetical protein
VKLDGGIFKDSTGFQYYYVPFYNHFSKVDTAYSKVLGFNKAGPNFMIVFYGKGRFYLHTDPRALSNYFLLQNNNYQYLQHLFSMTPGLSQSMCIGTIIITKGIIRNRNPATNRDCPFCCNILPWPRAFWLFLVLMGAYVLFGGKRRQRIVPTIAPNTNTTVAFTETIGRLYLQKKDNRNIADKLITYLLEHIRNQYFLNTSHINEDFIATLSRKSNNTKEGIANLFGLISNVQDTKDVSDEQLLLLNQQIENFYKNKI